MTSRPILTVRSAVVALAACLAAAACSSDSSSEPATTPALTTAPGNSSGASPVTEPPDASSPVGSTGTSTSEPDPDLTLAPEDIRLALVEAGRVEQPTAFAARPGDTTLFVASQPGTVYALRAGSEPVVVANLVERIRSGGEEGLLGLAFRPDGDEAYAYYTDLNGDLQVDAFPVDADGIFDTEARRPLINIAHPGRSNHNGGQLVVDGAGLLYIGTGDGGGSGDPGRHALDRSSLLGKVLRIDPRADGAAPYRIPPDNPFVDEAGVRGEIWSYGLRNPWRFSFDRATGDFWLGDVGERKIEEINLVRAADGAGKASNFGWSAYEGSRRYHDDQEADGSIKPVHQYEHQGNSASVTGGFVYRGNDIPSLYGAYVFGDQVRSTLWALRLTSSGKAKVAQIGGVETVSSFGEDNDGELYALSYTRGIVYRIVGA